jgi:hypothetical protein
MLEENAASSSKFRYVFNTSRNDSQSGMQSTTDASGIINTFLNTGCGNELNDYEQLKTYKLLMPLFIIFNTILPSSAPVERLFSFASKDFIIKILI